MTQTRKNLLWLLLSVAVIALDQFTKYLVLNHLNFGQPVVIFPWLNMLLDYNTGASFGFLNQAGGWQSGFFATVALVVSLIIFIWLYRLPANQAWTAAGLSFVLGGALGNLIDRIRFGHVIDFISVHFGNWHFAVFNIADSAITVGAILMILSVLLKK